jgi:hypothetical protein
VLGRGTRDFARYLNCDELKDLLDDEYDDLLKELLNQWTNLAHVLMITSYKLDFSQLLAMRYEYSLRTITSMTLTDERKHVMRNILSTCFKDGDSDGPAVFRKITKYVLTNVVY